ncbi:acyltransferase family protein [Donghicola mangrovi]|uniref:Acyltransferase n=1 Tax=Donghicola mangrovi TaxID=2729614 RepID=A0A850Q939_9RHOB|nr:acyltransferase [Donghicola mangrovi]NVO23005.1 acyltransferase [Donghicola mangrovi]
MKKIVFIQYLRAIAAISVILLHASTRFNSPEMAAIYNFFRFGHMGVDLFFVISGFIISHVSTNYSSNPISFFKARMLRILPQYWILTIIWYFTLILIPVKWADTSFSHLIESLLFIPHWHPSFPNHIWPFLIPGWTLNYEVFFYGIFSLILFVRKEFRTPILIGTFTTLVLLGIFNNSKFAIFVFIFNPILLEFLFGVLINDVISRFKEISRGVSIFCIFFGCLACVLFSTNYDPESPWTRVAYFALPFSFVFFGMLNLKIQLIHLPLLEKVGDASFSIYLLHTIVLTLIEKILLYFPFNLDWRYSLTSSIISIIAAIFLGMQWKTFIESPIQKLVKKLFLN